MLERPSGDDTPIALGELLSEVTGAQLVGNGATPISSLVYDSRQVRPGALFVAVHGQHADGHAFLAQAVEQGAAALVVDARHWDAAQVVPPVPLAVVPDSRVALAPLAAAFYHYPARRLGLLGVTGTKGKSTTSDLISQLFDAGGRRNGMITTVEFKLGEQRWANSTRQSTPEAPEVQALLAEMVAAGCAYAVLEATSHALSPRWNRLGGCAFAAALFLNLGHEHLDYHGTLEQYRADKARLFEMLGEAAPDGSAPWAIVNRDDSHARYFLDAAPAHAQRLSFAIDGPADIRAHELVATPSGATMQVATPWGAAALRLALPGRFNVYNSLGALAVALSQGIALETAIVGLERARSVRGRMEPVEAGQPFTVIVDYAHNPSSFEQVFAMLRPLTKGRIIALFGSAGERDVAKRAVQGEIAGRFCDLLVLTDEDPRGEDRAAILAQIAQGAERAGKQLGTGYLCLPDRAEAIAAALQAAQPGDLVLLLGKGHEGSIIYADHSLPWDEADVARRALHALGYGGE